MKKFKSKFATLLRYRKNLKDQAMADYAMAQSELNRGIEALEKLYTEVDENFKNTQNVREQGGTTGESLKTHDEFFAGQQIRIENQRQVVRQLKEIAEEKHMVLVEKLVEQKSIEKLEEKEKKAHQEMVKKKEQIRLDDLAVMTQKRGARL